MVTPAGYFRDYWSDRHSGISAEMRLSKIFNPRVAVQELLDELDSQRLRRTPVNTVFFQRTIGRFLVDDPACTGPIKDALIAIQQEFPYIAQRPSYMANLCRTTLSHFKSLAYLKSQTAYLKSTLSSDALDENIRRKLCTVVDSLIMEFRELGYGKEEIKRIPNRIFAPIENLDADGTVHWDFPHQIAYP
ncbi:hypothetical protein, partial [Agrobacterium tumefaciens]|uniref:hypothetical protein n=1 Tax=Agrobacterium tumefaciens TaxID=358 RepID=UPI003BA2AD93